MTEPEVTTSGIATMGRINAESVKNAIVESVMVNPIMPVSPIKNLAGGMLNQRNAKVAPAKTDEKAAMSI